AVFLDLLDFGFPAACTHLVFVHRNNLLRPRCSERAGATALLPGDQALSSGRHRSLDDYPTPIVPSLGQKISLRASGFWRCKGRTLGRARGVWQTAGGQMPSHPAVSPSRRMRLAERQTTTARPPEASALSMPRRTRGLQLTAPYPRPRESRSG